MNNLGRILLVDGDEVSCFFSVRPIRNMKVTEELVLAEKGYDSLKLMKSTSYSLVILDSEITCTGGVEFLEALRQLQESRGMAIPPIVVLVSSLASSTGSKGDESHPMVKGYLTKPLTEEGVSFLLSLVTESAKGTRYPML